MGHFFVKAQPPKILLKRPPKTKQDINKHFSEALSNLYKKNPEAKYICFS